MTRRASFVAGVATLVLAGLALPAHAGGKRLPKARSIIECVRATGAQTHYVRTPSVKPAAAQSAALDVARPYNQSHFIREGAPR